MNGTDYAVSSSNGTFTVNGTAYAVTVKENAASAKPAANASAGQKASAAAQATPASQPATLQAAPQTAAPKPAATPTASGSGTKLLAPVTGTLLRYSVAEGTKVSEGQTVIILESMKMELEINAPAAGTVHFVAAAGAQVAEGDPLAEIH